MLEYPQRCVISGQGNFTIYSAINRCKCRASMVALTINGKIIGFLHINNSIGCISCRKKVVPNKDSEDLGQCKDCKLTQIISSCGTQWYMHILVQSSTNPSEQHRLTLFSRTYNSHEVGFELEQCQ